MPLYLNELAPWERKSEYLSNIKLGKDVRSQLDEIGKAIGRQTATNISSANAIITSRERSNDILKDISASSKNISDGIEGLRSSFEWGISEVIWQIEQNRSVLQNILEVLMAPLDTQAKERKKRAAEAYANGWLDDAEEDFIEAAKLNKYDFTIHISLGMIYLFGTHNKQKALESFENAIKYAKPKSDYYTTYALLHKALIKYDFGDIKAAEACTSEAMTLTPNIAEAYYQNAQYNAQLKNAAKAVKSLENAIKIDKMYCIKADKDPFFKPVRSAMLDLFDNLRTAEADRANGHIRSIVSKLEEFESVIKCAPEDISAGANVFRNKFSKFKIQLAELNNIVKRDSYFDYIHINNKLAPELAKQIKEHIAKYKKWYAENQSKHKICINQSIGKSEQSKRTNYITTKFFLIAGLCIVPAAIALIFEEGYGKLWAIAFCIPGISQILLLLLFIPAIVEQRLDEVTLKLIWGAGVYLALALAYLVVSNFITRAKMNRSVSKHEQYLDSISDYGLLVEKL